MKNEEAVTFKKIVELESAFNAGMENFKIEEYTKFDNLISEIQEEITWLLIVSEERYEKRLSRRKDLSKKFKIDNEIGEKEALSKHIAQNPAELLQKLKKIGIEIDEKGGLHIKKLTIKRGDFDKDFIKPGFVPKKIATDHFGKIKEEWEIKAQKFILKLKGILETAKTNIENFYQSYNTLEELFNKLGIKPQVRDYEVFEKGVGSSKLKSGSQNNAPEKQAPEFKKVGYIFGYFKDNNIVIKPKHILSYPDGNLCIYIESKNISILVSDVLTSNNFFKDATYIIKGPGLIFENEPISKEMIGEYNGKRVLFSDNRGNRVEEILEQDPNGWEEIKNQNGPREDGEYRELITDKEEFIKIIQQNFTQETLDSTTYGNFASAYNLNVENKYILRANLYSNSLLLGLIRGTSIENITNVIWGKEKVAEDNGSNFMGNPTIKCILDGLRGYTDFKPQEHLGNVNYTYWTLKLLKIAYGITDSNAIRSLPALEKKEKLKTITGIDIPLSVQTLSMWLGGTSCSTSEYQKLLRKRFIMISDKKTNDQEFSKVEKDIQKMEKASAESASLHKKVSNRIGIAKGGVADIMGTLSIKTPKKKNTKSGETDVDGPQIVKETHQEISLEKQEIIPEGLTVENIKQFGIYTGKVVSFEGDRVHIKIDGSEVVGCINHSKQIFKHGDTVEVIVRGFGQSRDEKKYPLLTIKKQDGHEKVLRFLDGKDKLKKKLEQYATYKGVVNNVEGPKVRISLSGDTSGFADVTEKELTKHNIAVGKIFDVQLMDYSGATPVFKIK